MTAAPSWSGCGGLAVTRRAECRAEPGARVRHGPGQARPPEGPRRRHGRGGAVPCARGVVEPALPRAGTRRRVTLAFFRVRGRGPSPVPAGEGRDCSETSSASARHPARRAAPSLTCASPRDRHAAPVRSSGTQEPRPRRQRPALPPAVPAPRVLTSSGSVRPAFQDSATTPRAGVLHAPSPRDAAPAGGPAGGRRGPRRRERARQ